MQQKNICGTILCIDKFGARLQLILLSGGKGFDKCIRDCLSKRVKLRAIHTLSLRTQELMIGTADAFYIATILWPMFQLDIASDIERMLHSSICVAKASEHGFKDLDGSEIIIVH